MKAIKSILVNALFFIAGLIVCAVVFLGCCCVSFLLSYVLGL